MCHAQRGDAFGHRLDQVDRLTGDDRDDAVGEFCVVHGGGEIVAGRGTRELACGVHHEDLAVASLVGEHAVVAGGPQAGESDGVFHDASPATRSRSTTAIASRC